MALSSDKVAAYMKAQREFEELREAERRADLVDLLAKEMRNALIDEMVEIFARNVSKYMLNVATACRRELGNSLCFALTNSRETINNADQTGPCA